MRTLAEKNYSYYEKAVQRLKKCGILDPTSVIAELEKEIDQYRDKIQCYEEDFRKKRKESYIKDVLGKFVGNPGIISEENEEYLFVTTSYGTSKYSKLQLAIFWLEHSNDFFYETFGFNWVPEFQMQEKARKILNDNHTQALDKKIKINIDFIDSLVYATDTVQKGGKL